MGLGKQDNMCSNERTKVLLVYDHTIVCEGLRLLFQSEPDMVMLDGTDTDKTPAQLAREFKPDVVVMDLDISGTDNVELSRQIIDEHPNIRIVALIGHAHAHILDEALRAGISGFVMMECNFGELVRAVRAVRENSTYMCSEIRDVLAIGYLSQIQTDEANASSALTDRECEVIRLLSLGMTSKEIAMHMNVSSKTIDASRRRIMDKLGIDSIAQLVKHAIRIGLATV